MEDLFCFANVRTAFQQRGGEAGGDARRELLVEQSRCAFDRSWISAQENAELVFGVRQPLPNRGQSRGGVLQGGFRTRRFQGRSRSSGQTAIENPEALGKGIR